MKSPMIQYCFSRSRNIVFFVKFRSTYVAPNKHYFSYNAGKIDAALRELLKNILTFPIREGSGGVGYMF